MIKTNGNQKRAVTIFCIILALLILCSVLNWGVVTSWGQVRITSITLVGDNGREYTGLLYTPKNATNATPAPGLLCSHGYSGNARNHESWSMEYARRGFVVLSIDNFGSGDGEFNESSLYPSVAAPATGGQGGGQGGQGGGQGGAASQAQASNQSADNNLIHKAFLNYLFTMPIVDKENIVVAGHSMGCRVAVMSSGSLPVKAYVLADPAPGMRVTAGTQPASALWLYGTADKLYSINTSKSTARSVFNSLGAGIEGVEVTEGTGESAKTLTIVEEGKTYKTEDGKIYRHQLVPDQIHEAAFINTTAIGYQLDFVQEVVQAPNPIPGSQQNWPIKDVLGFIGMALFVAFLCATVNLLINCVPFFGQLVQPLPRNIGLRKVGFGISVAAGILFPIIAIYFGCFGILRLFGGISAYSNVEYGIFRIRFTNIAISVVIALTLMGMVMLCLFLFTDAKKAKANLHDMGLTSEGKKGLDLKQIGIAALLAFTVLFIGFAYLSIQREMLRTDFYCLFFGFKSIPGRKFIYYIPYIVIWMICFAFSAISMNVERRLPDSGNPTKDMVVAIVFNGLLNCLAVTLLVIVENYMQVHKGAGVYGFETFGTDVTRLWGMPIGMFVGGAGSTYCYRKTGSIWLGAMLFGALAALMACTFGQVRLA